MKTKILLRAGIASVASLLMLSGSMAQTVLASKAEPYVAKPEISFQIEPVKGLAKEGAGAAKVEKIETERSNLTEIGLNNARGHNYQGSQDAGLRDAVRSIAPPTYAIRSSSCVPLQAPAPFRSGSNWIESLNTLAAEAAINVTVDHNAREVLLMKRAAVDPDAKRNWMIFRTDTTLKRALERWTDPSCVTLQWDIPFPLSADADTEYQDKTLWEALMAFAKDMESSSTPLRITKSRNNAVRVFLDSSR